MRRHGLSRGASRRNFSRGAMLSHRANYNPYIMRGGIRF